MKRKRKKSLNSMYGDFIYSTVSMRRSQEDLLSRADVSLREAYADMEDLLAKTFFLVENGEASRNELKKLHSYASKLETMINDFKYNFKR